MTATAADFDTIVDGLTALAEIATAPPDDDRSDGVLHNALLKFGKGQGLDVEQHSKIVPDCDLDQAQLEDLFTNDAYAQRVVTLMPEEMAKGGFEVEGLSDNEKTEMEDWSRDARLMDLFRQVSIIAAIYNKGAAIVLDVDDGQAWSDPVNVNKIKSVRPLFVKSGYQVYPVYSLSNQPQSFTMTIPDLSGDLQSVEMPDQELERILKTFQGGVGLNLHPDRVLWFPGIWVPEDVEKRKQGSPSRLQLFWKHYSRYELGMKLATNLMARISVVHMSRTGWVDLLNRNDKEAQDQINRQIEVLQYSLTNSGIVFSDKEKNTVEIISRSLAEVANILDRLFNQMLGASGLSKFELMGIADGGGLSNDDLRDRIFRAERVHNDQETYWRSHLEKLLRYWFAARGKEPKRWTLKFPTTLKLTVKEEMDAATAKVNAWMLAVQAQAVSPNEMRKALSEDPIFAPYIDMSATSPADDAQAQQIADMEAQIAQLAGEAPPDEMPEEEMPVEEEEVADDAAVAE